MTVTVKIYMLQKLSRRDKLFIVASNDNLSDRTISYRKKKLTQARLFDIIYNCSTKTSSLKTEQMDHVKMI